MNIIDPHLHFFDLIKGDYTWLKDNPPNWPNIEKIRQDHLPEALLSNTQVNLRGCVHVEAGFDNNNPQRELDWLQDILPNLPYKAVAYAPIDADKSEFRHQLNALSHTHLVALRDITEGADAARLLSPNVADNIALLHQQNYHFEAQFEFANHPVAQRLYEIYSAIPDATLVLNHAGFMERSGAWQSAIDTLSKLNNCTIKFSGHEMLDSPLCPTEQLAILLDAFGEDRVMLASNHPVCLIQRNFDQQWQHYFNVVSQIAPTAWHKLSYENAKHLYQFAL
ncbi:hypothetical protein A7985_16965 [Pseudoalteromonas luteoviolacea]|uniref:Amidohydrolase-related domain-containing protein n=1 Tax=Pseudoalteromonas luteoviolacea TaxID=43657 RepID=A0A1C0TN75_9GAMM|nr:amidohydrolase family protein [Pseudoalteromonas luteoviolacea]MBQ4811990.1 amidohydrolase family protein [Pseudoalteromonas luteoviolacea]OCQ20126.1 hypothetical protein A7985_16965 [Pseudoalteromonas luteoviolacea]